MTQTPPSQLTSDDDASQMEQDQQRLLEWLADHDVACPLCSYNLRNLRTPRCPECGNGLTLGVSLVEPFLAAWIAVVAALLPQAGVGAIFGVAFLNQLLRFGFRGTFDGSPPAGVCIMMAYAVTAIPLSLLAIWKRRRFMQWERSTQKLFAWLAWGLNVAMAVIFLSEIQ